MQVKFTKHFTCNPHGNVYPGKKLTLDNIEAKKYVDLNLAEYVEVPKTETKPIESKKSKKNKNK